MSTEALWCARMVPLSTGSRGLGLSQIVLKLFPFEMHEKGILGRSGSGPGDLAPSKALLNENPVVLFVTAESGIPKGPKNNYTT